MESQIPKESESNKSPHPILIDERFMDINNPIYAIVNETGERIGEIDVKYDPDNTTVGLEHIYLIESSRGKGYGKAVYLQIPNIPSPDGRKYTFLSDDVLELSDQAKGVWNSLVRDGKAILREDGHYQMHSEV